MGDVVPELTADNSHIPATFPNAAPVRIAAVVQIVENPPALVQNTALIT